MKKLLITLFLRYCDAKQHFIAIEADGTVILFNERPLLKDGISWIRDLSLDGSTFQVVARLPSEKPYKAKCYKLSEILHKKSLKEKLQSEVEYWVNNHSSAREQKYKYYAIDEDGDLYGYENKPITGSGCVWEDGDALGLLIGTVTNTKVAKKYQKLLWSRDELSLKD